MSFKIMVVDDTNPVQAFEDTKTAAEIVTELDAPSGTTQASIADVTVTGVYGDDDDALETAINSIIAVLLEYGMIEPAA